MSLRDWFRRLRPEPKRAGPPPWEPRPNPYAEYAFDLIPLPGARIRVQDVDETIAAAVLAAATTETPALAVAGPTRDTDDVFVRLDGEVHRLGAVPAGYRIVYTEAYFRSSPAIPLAAWATPDGHVVDVLMARAEQRPS